MVWGDSSVSFPRKMSVLLFWSSLRLLGAAAAGRTAVHTEYNCAVKTRRTKDSRQHREGQGPD